MMRKLFIVGALLLGAMSVQAQDNAAVVKTEKSTVKLSDKLLKKCEALMKDAQWYLKHKEFGKAKEKLAEIVAINPKDVQAKVLLEQCEQNTVQYGESAEKKPNKWSLGIPQCFGISNLALVSGILANVCIQIHAQYVIEQ